jgi:integrase
MSKITLRKKPIKGNRQSLYLDFYPAVINPETRKTTRREFLGLVVYNEIEHVEETYLDQQGKPQLRIVPVRDKKGQLKKLKLDPVQRQHNKETFALAESIKSKRQLDLQQQEYGFLKKKVRDVDFIEYFDALTKKKKGSDYTNFSAAGKHLYKFTSGKLQTHQIDENFCNDFREYLLNATTNRSENYKLSQSSAHLYFYCFRNSLKQAFKDGILKHDLFPMIKPIPAPESSREFLTQEELQSLVHTVCSMPILKKAALFSALTGLRWADIEKMTWSEMRHSNKDGYSIKFQQKKTSGQETLPISEQAYKILGEPGKPETRVFSGLKYSAYVNLHFKLWIAKSGITKHITFHSMRHTNATLMLSNGVDLYTVSKMLGHRDITTTQIYAKVIDKKKQEAANSIKLNF